MQVILSKEESKIFIDMKQDFDKAIKKETKVQQWLIFGLGAGLGFFPGLVFSIWLSMKLVGVI